MNDYILKIEYLGSGGRGKIISWFKTLEEAKQEARKEYKVTNWKKWMMIKKDGLKVWEFYEK